MAENRWFWIWKSSLYHTKTIHTLEGHVMTKNNWSFQTIFTRRQNCLLGGMLVALTHYRVIMLVTFCNTGCARLSSLEHRLGTCTRFWQTGNSSESKGLAQALKQWQTCTTTDMLLENEDFVLKNVQWSGTNTLEM